MRQQVQVSAAKIKTIFPLAVHLRGYNLHGEKFQISRRTHLRPCCGKGLQWDRQGKKFLTLAADTCTCSLMFFSNFYNGILKVIEI